MLSELSVTAHNPEDVVRCAEREKEECSATRVNDASQMVQWVDRARAQGASPLHILAEKIFLRNHRLYSTSEIAASQAFRFALAFYRDKNHNKTMQELVEDV